MSLYNSAAAKQAHAKALRLCYSSGFNIASPTTSVRSRFLRGPAQLLGQIPWIAQGITWKKERGTQIGNATVEEGEVKTNGS